MWLGGSEGQDLANYMWSLVPFSLDLPLCSVSWQSRAQKFCFTMSFCHDVFASELVMNCYLRNNDPK